VRAVPTGSTGSPALYLNMHVPFLVGVGAFLLAAR
jgi:hypothetical protein